MKRKLIQLGAALLIAAIIFNSATARAGTHVWSGAGGSSWNLDFNWSSGGKPAVGEAPPVILVFPPAGAKLTTNDIPGLLIDQIRVTGDNYRFGASGGASLTFNTNAPWAISNAPSCDTTIGANVVLNGEALIDGDGTLTFLGAISGPGGLRVSGPVTTIAGNTANAFTGLTTVQNGTLQLSKSNGPAITGDVEIGITFGANNNEKIVYLRSHQIADTSAVLVKGTGLLNLNGFSDTVGEITLSGGEIETGIGLLTLGGNVIVETGPDIALIDGKLSLGSRSKNFNVASGAWLDVLATMSGGTDVGFGKSGPGFMSLSASNGFSGPVTVNAGALAIFDPQALGTTNWGTTVLNGAVLEFSYSGLIGYEQLTLNGHGTNDLGALALTGAFDETLLANIVLASPASISVASNLTLTFKGKISGAGDLHKTGAGELWLDGGPANTHSGTTYVDEGQLTLGKADNVAAMAGPLVVGDNIGGVESDILKLLGNGQLAPGAAVTVRSTGLLDVDNTTQTLGNNLTLDGSGRVHVNNFGVLNLPALVTFTGLNPTPTDPNNPVLFSTASIYGLGQAHLTVPTTIDSTWINSINVDITGPAAAHLIKTGDGYFNLAGSNSYSGLTIIKEGVLSCLNNFGLGTSAGATIVTNSGSLSMSGKNIANEPLVLAGDYENGAHSSLQSFGTNTWGGPITLVSNSVIESDTSIDTGLLRLNGAIGGTGKLIKAGKDPVELGGALPNTYSGATHVNEGTLLLNKIFGPAVPSALVIGDGTNAATADEVKLLAADQIADSSVVEVRTFGLLNLNSFSDTIGSLQGGGVVSTVLGTLAAGGNNFTTTFSGLFGGVGFTSFIKQGTGTLLFTGTNSASGRTIVRGGKLFAHGLISGAVTVSNNATLGGNGAVGNVTATNGVVNPGAGAGSIDVKNLTLDAGSTLRFEINGTNAGVNYDQINAVGVVNLGGCTLDATVGFAGALSNKFVLIQNDGADAVIGMFAGLAEGATATIGNAQFKISYAGGDGNDVVLTQITKPPQPSMGGVTPLPGGNIQVGGEGIPGTTYNVLASTNLNAGSWLLIGTAPADALTGKLQFTDTNAVNFPMRFYQFVLP